MSSSPLNILLVGGSGFLSGTLARRAVAQGHHVWAVTRGQRDLPNGVTGITADRHDRDAFQQAIAGAGMEWDLTVDCIGYDPVDAKQDIAVFRDLTPHFVFVSTDFVFDPAHRTFPQPEESDHYLTNNTYGAKKRRCELEILNGDTGGMAWTILRPCHIYGPGSLLGCLPLHSRDQDLIAKLKAGEPLRLVGGGHFLQQPILARDLSDLVLSFHGNEQTCGEIFCAAGPDIIESVEYYRIIARILDAPEPTIEEIPVSRHLTEQPQSVSFVCHRIYSLDKLESTGASVPSTPVEQGLREHVESLL